MGNNSTYYGAPSGLSTANASVTPGQTLADSGGFTLRDFSAQKTGAALSGPHTFIGIFAVVNGTPDLICDIVNSTTCQGGGISVPAGATLTIKILTAAEDNAIPAYDLLFGFRAT